MGLLKVVRLESSVQLAPRMSRFTAWLQDANDAELQAAVLAANVNVIRRVAPFIYLLAWGYTAASWMVEDAGDDTGYVRSFTVQDFRTSNDDTRAQSQQSASAAVIGILLGDVLPVVHLLRDDNFQLVCLRSAAPLEDVCRIGLSSQFERGEYAGLSNSDGCLLTGTDGVRFSLRTTDPDSYSRLFFGESS